MHPSVARTLESIGDLNQDMANMEKSRHRHQVSRLLYSQSLGNYSQALELRRAIYNNGDHPTIANTLARLGETYHEFANDEKSQEHVAKSLDYYADSARHFAVAIEMRQRLHSDLSVSGSSPDHPTISELMHLLGRLYNDYANCEQSEDRLANAFALYEKSRENLERALTMRRRTHAAIGSDHFSVANTLYFIGALYFDFGNHMKSQENLNDSLVYYKRSITCYSFSLAIKRRLFRQQEHHPGVGDTLHNLAMAYQVYINLNILYTELCIAGSPIFT